MKISLQWLQDFLPGPLNENVLAEALTNGGLPVENFARHGDDSVMDVEVTSNRSDCLSHLGVARELSALCNRTLHDPDPSAVESASPASAAVSVQYDALDLCPHYTARILRNVKIGNSPAWLTRRLEAVGLRSVNNVVDVTNYVLFEMGQPLHAFDYAKLQGRQIIVRRARAGETLVSIDGRERSLTPEMLVIADAVQPVALAGVMGGRDSEVSHQTRDILLESARFAPLSIRKTARSLSMGSDSSYRYERGIDPQLPLRAGLRAAQLILEVAGGELLSGYAEAGSSGTETKTIILRLDRLKQVLGVHWPASQVVDALRRDHLNPVLHGDMVECAIPSYRLDLNIEVDLIEEAARIVGYENVPVHDQIAIRLTSPDPSAKGIETIRSTLTAAGFFESITFSFVSDALAHDFIPPGAAADQPLMRASSAVRKADANLRPSLLPGLLESLRHNESAGVPDPRLFEIGSAFWNEPGPTARERRQVALVGGEQVSDIRGVVESLLGRLNPKLPLRIVPATRGGFARGACGRIDWNQKPIGWLGKIERSTAEKLSLRQIPAAAELDLTALLEGMQHVPKLLPLPKFPAIRRDLSLVVPEATRYEKIETLIREQNPQHMEELQYVTTYRGKPLEKGLKSITITLVFRSPDETLVSDAVDTSIQRVIAAARAQGWEQRA